MDISEEDACSDLENEAWYQNFRPTSQALVILWGEL